MKPIRKALASVALALGLTAAWFVGGSLVKDVQFARAQEQVQASREQISSVQDLASVYKAVGKAVEPSVVSINVTKTIKNPVQRFHMPNDDLLRRFFQDQNDDGFPDAPDGQQFEIPDQPQQYQAQGTGSGVIVETDGDTGYIVTNNHVAGDATEMDVNLSDGRVIKNAKLVGADPKSDIAVVKIQADHLIPAKWGNSDKLEKGDIVLAFGSPFGYVGSMTHGIISALHRQAGIISNSFAYENFIQTDASINPGNSGGPLVDLKGDIIGINTAIATRSGGWQGIGFAVPANQAKFVYNAIKEKGKVVRGWLGVEIADVAKLKDEASALGYSGDNGVIVKGTMNNTPAFGKLQSGDIITSLDGKNMKDSTQLRNAIAATAPGTQVTLGVMRSGKQQQVQVKLGEQPENYAAVTSGGGANNNQAEGGNSNSVTSLGLRLAPMSDELAQRYSLEQGQQGAVITGVKPGSTAQMAGLRAGDVITKIDSKPVKSPQDVSEALSGKDLSKGVKLYVATREGTQFLFLKVEKPNKQQPDLNEQ